MGTVLGRARLLPGNGLVVLFCFGTVCFDKFLADAGADICGRAVTFVLGVGVDCGLAVFSSMLSSLLLSGAYVFVLLT